MMNRFKLNLRSAVVATAALALLLGVTGVYAATTIGSNVSTDGTVTCRPYAGVTDHREQRHAVKPDDRFYLPHWR